MNKDLVRETLEMAAMRLKKALDSMQPRGDAFHYAAAAEHDVKEAIAELDKPERIVGWRYRVLVNKHSTGAPLQGEISMLDIYGTTVWGKPGEWRYSNGFQRPNVDWMCEAQPLFNKPDEPPPSCALSWQEQYPTNYLYESPLEIQALKKHIAAAKLAEPTVLERLETWRKKDPYRRWFVIRAFEGEQMIINEVVVPSGLESTITDTVIAIDAALKEAGE
jgi:hypothetical protein